MFRPRFALTRATALLFIALLAISVGSSAQGTDAGNSNSMTLEQVIETANANYPAIMVAQAQQKSAQGSIAVARTAYLPRTDVLWQTNRATANNVFGLLLPQTTIPSVTGSVLTPDSTRSAWNS